MTTNINKIIEEMQERSMCSNQRKFCESPDYTTINQIANREEIKNECKLRLGNLWNNQLPGNVYIYGEHGTGKTLLINTILNETIRNTKSKIIPITIFHDHFKSEYGVYTSIIYHIEHEIEIKKIKHSTSTQKAFDTLLTHITKNNLKIILILKDIELIDYTHIFKAVNNINEKLDNNKIAMLGEAHCSIEQLPFNNKECVNTFTSQIYFHPYTKTQLIDIVTTKVNEFFKKNSVPKELIEYSAEYVLSHGLNIKNLFNIICNAEDYAILHNKKTIDRESINHAIYMGYENGTIIEYIKQMDPRLKIPLKAIRTLSHTGNEWVTIDKIYNHIKQSGITEYFTIQNNIHSELKRLEAFGMIKTKKNPKSKYLIKSAKLKTEPEIIDKAMEDKQ